ncbi:McrC family protein [Flavobacterium tibetense]|uniref:Restriction endonuclease n=1 Tax=Flavobacterium tibetense TaxID=2233533 RepID=A0A365P3H6_9FLAO|nr:restriction endonuclease [Flavobacterium tibetense]RBA29083.1 restriction endonuclease [Flavobacterium tibetense]
MSKKNFIQVFEYQKLKYDENSDFKKNHFDAMVLFNEKNQNKYFTIVHKGVLFNSYVGVIQIGSLTIEILPKADKSDNPDKGTWQNALLNMLKVCKHIQVDNVSETNLNKKYNSILEVYFEMYLNEIESLVKKGLIKKYRRVQSNQNALKGKLVFSQNIQKNVVHKERFYCEHQVYDKDHLIHQILFRGLLVLEDLLNNHLKDKLNRLLFEFQDYQQLNINKSHFNKLNTDRKTRPYLKSIDIAKMLILNYSPNLNSGNDNMLTLLFDMNKLWEEYIYRILQKHKPEGYQISFQNKEDFWETKTIRPDIVITSNTGEIFVIDTKWKIVEANKPADDDLKQMFTYNLHWKAEKSMLLYPKVNQEDSKFGEYHYNDLKKKCKLGFVSVLNGSKVREGRILSQDIFDKLVVKN